MVSAWAAVSVMVRRWPCWVCVRSLSMLDPLPLDKAKRILAGTIVTQSADRLFRV